MGNTMVLFFSEEMVARVWRYLSWRAAGLSEMMSRFLQGLARLLFSLSSDDLSSGLSGSLSLSSHGSLQILGKPDILHLNSLDVNSPGVGSVVNLGLQVFGNGVSLRECFRQGLGSQDVPEGGGRKEFSGIGVVFNLTNSIHRVADVVVNNSVNLHSHRVLGQDLLRGDIKGDGPQVDNLDFINAGDDEEQARTNSSPLLQSSKPEDNGSLVLRDDPDAEEDGNGEGNDDEDDGDGFQQERTTIKALFRLIGLIVIHSHNLVLGRHFRFVLFSYLLLDNN